MEVHTKDGRPVDFWERCSKAVALTWPAPPLGTLERCAAQGIAAFDEPDRGLRVLGRLAAFGTARERTVRGSPVPLAFDWPKYVSAADTVVPEDRCHAILRAAGLPAADLRNEVDVPTGSPVCSPDRLSSASRWTGSTCRRSSAAARRCWSRCFATIYSAPWSRSGPGGHEGHAVFLARTGAVRRSDHRHGDSAHLATNMSIDAHIFETLVKQDAKQVPVPDWRPRGS